MASLITNIQLITPSSNYMWWGLTPSPAFIGASNYYINFSINKTFPSPAAAYSTNSYIYSSVYGGNSWIDIHNVLQDYVSYDLTQMQKTGFTQAVNSFAAYNVTAKEMSGSTVLTTSIGATKYMWNGVMPTNTFNTVLIPQTYIMSGTSSNINFLTNWQGPYMVRQNDSHCLAWLQDSEKLTMKLIINNNTGLTFWTAQQGTTILPYGMNYFGSGYLEVNNYLWQDIHGASHTNVLSNNNATTYTLSLVDPWGTYDNISVPMVYNVNFECNNIMDLELIWLNQLGGWDFYTFYKEIHKMISSDKTIYTNNDYSYNMGVDGISTPTNQRGETIISNKVVTSYNVISKVLSNEMFDSMKELFYSNEVYCFLNGQMYPVIIDIDDKQEIYNNYNRFNGRNAYNFTFHMANSENTILN